MYEKTIIFIFICVICFTGCSSTRVVSDITERTTKYRELEGEIRDGETELAVTGEKLESTSEQITDSINSIESTSKQLEQSIEESKGNEQEIGNLLQRIRTREVSPDIIAEFRNKYPELFIE